MLQMRTSLYNSILAGAVPAVFDSQLAKVLPFSDLMDWSQLIVHVPPEKIIKGGKDVIKVLEVFISPSSLCLLTDGEML